MIENLNNSTTIRGISSITMDIMKNASGGHRLAEGRGGAAAAIDHHRSRSRFDLHEIVASDPDYSSSHEFESEYINNDAFVNKHHPSMHDNMPATLRPGSPTRINSPSPGRDITNTAYSSRGSGLGLSYDKPLPSAPKLSKAKTCLTCNMGFQSGEKIAQIGPGIVHFDCFRCSQCRNHLEYSQYYYSKEYKKIYCHVDYHETFSERCAYCETPIESDGIFALNKNWHRDHFFCSECSKPFGEKSDYTLLDDSPACIDCYAKKTAPVCWKCSHKCMNQTRAIDALGRTWCTTCFSCEECNEPFATNEFILRENGILVCEPCEVSRIKKAIWGDVQ